MSSPLGPWAGPKDGAKRRLSLDAVVAAGLEILATDGVDAVTMRAVAGRLDTGPASLYAHVKSKAELHALMLDAVIGEVEVPEPDPDRWKEQVKQVCWNQYHAMARHPGSAAINLGNIPTGPNALRTTEGLIAILLAGGLSKIVASLAMDLLTLFATSSAYEHTVWTLRARQAGTGSEEAVVAQVREFYTGLATVHHPLLASMADEITSGDNHDRFEFGLDALLGGLETMRDWRLPSASAAGHQQVHDQPGYGGGQQE